MNAYLNIIGMETLGLRMERICNNAYQLAQVLEKTGRSHRQLPPSGNPALYHDLAQTQLTAKAALSSPSAPAPKNVPISSSTN